ncbi:4-(cytidine 5'-diphospho)-2-C-methyl-D-erythritol kinase [Rubrivivax albus]|uniref:4-(cytidine 5'-diphospho)-2-C-methyl-D-erythritol kinase n=1 Tax=Rubrivivax albus TaxID=2499835 RepID=UPI0018EE5C3A|nr:4-(cytidine 5'-diphospho)-2-C-methyl-D-erythritol kinase [Rubrivivax albus]
MRALFDLPAPAKLNLFLHVIGRRADGYHLLQSPFVLIDWCDTLHLERRVDGRVQRHDIGATLPDDDLCLRAARLLQAEASQPLGVDITIEKRLPWGAGLGGGSSDAATVLLGLNQLWGLHWPRTRLATLGASLGADVPFFIGGQDAFVEGIGERLRPLQLPRQWYAVVKPPTPLPTAQIFTHPALTRDTEAVIVEGSLDDACRQMDWAGGQGRNDLQPVAESLCPEVAQAARWLEARFGNSRMTGSGSAVFARAGTGDVPVATFPQAELPAGWEGRMCRGLGRHPLADWAD